MTGFPQDDELPETLVTLSEGAGVPLVCVPATSGSPYSYGRLAGALPGRAIYGLEAPGLQDGLLLAQTIGELAGDYADVLGRGGLCGPSAGGQPVQLLGWSMGGIVAFELARLLGDAGTPPAAVLLVDPPTPQASGYQPPETEVVLRFLIDFTGAGPDELPEDIDHVEGVTPGESGFAEIMAALQKAEIIPEDLDADLLEERYEVFRAGAYALLGYQPSGRYPGTVTLIRAEQSIPDLPAEPWHGLADRLDERVIAGNHYSVIHGTDLTPLLSVLAAVPGPSVSG